MDGLPEARCRWAGCGTAVEVRLAGEEVLEVNESPSEVVSRITCTSVGGSRLGRVQRCDIAGQAGLERRRVRCVSLSLRLPA